MPPYMKYDLAPDLTLADEEGRPHALRDHKGRNAVLVLFEAVADEATKQALTAFRDRPDAFRDEHTEILLVSTDPVEVTRRYRDKTVLPFTFLSDPDARLAHELGAYDRRDHRVQRTTILVDRDGRIAQRVQGTDPPGHAGRALRHVQEIDMVEEWTVPVPAPT